MSALFDKAFAQAKQIPYNPEWANGTGYFDYAVRGKHAPELSQGEVVAAVTPMPNNRRIIIVGTMKGNVVFFERYTSNQSGVFACNMDYEIKKVFAGKLPNAILNEEDVVVIVGDGTGIKNIGERLKPLGEVKHY